MNLESSLRLLTIALPALAALLVWLWRGSRPRAQRRFASIALALTGLSALALFLVSGQAACVFSLGQGNCTLDGLATLSVCLLSAVMLAVCLRREENSRRDYAYMALLCAVWAGIAVSNNVLVMFLLIFLIPIVVSAWLKTGTVGPIQLGRDEFRDDWGPKR